MAADFFDQTASLLSNSAERLAAATATPASAPAQPAAPAVDLVRSFEAAADQFGVPVDALLAMAEKDSGFDYLSRSRGPGAKSRGLIRVGDDDMARGVNPYVPEQAIGAAARKLRGFMDGGMSLDDAIKAHGGGDDYLADIRGRAKRLADMLYSEETPVDPAAHSIPESNIKPAEKSNFARDAYFQTVGGVNKGIGQVVRGVGEAVATIGDYTTTPILNRIFGREGKTPNALTPVAKALDDFGKKGQSFVSADTKEAIKQSSPGGDLFKPSTWTLGKNPSLRGYAALGLDVFGGMLPVIAASVASGGSAAVGAAVGGAQGGGSAAQQAEEAIVEMAKSPAADNGKPGATVLEQESAYYRELLAAGKTPKQALNLTRLAASRLAFAFTTPVSALGGAATSKLMHPATKVAAGAALPGRVAARNGASALEEGMQEAGEQIAQNAGTNAGAGTNIDLTDDTFGNFILGALGGGVPGAVGGALSKRAGTRDQTAPLASSTPTPAAPTPANASPPAPPSGPLGRALDTGAPRLSEVAKPAGGAVTVTDEVGQITGHVVGQDKDGVTFQSADGQRFLYSPAEIASGAVKVEAAPAETVSAPPAPMAPADAPRAEIAPRAGEDRTFVAPLAATDAARLPVASGEAGADSRPVAAVANAQSEDPKTGFWVKRLEGGDPKNISYALMRGDDHVGMAALTLDKFDGQGRPVSGYIESIGGRDYSAPTGEGWQSGVNSLGPRAILALRRQFQADFPTVSTLNADRASGARFGGDYERTVADQKPMQVNLRAEVAGKGATTDTAPVARADDTASRATGSSKIEAASDPRNEAARQIDPELAQASEPALRVKIKTLAMQARNAGGWTAEMKSARREIEVEIGKRQRAAEAPASAAPAATDARETSPAASARESTGNYAPAPVTSIKSPTAPAAAKAAKPSVAASAPARGMSKAELSSHLVAGEDGDLLSRLIDDGRVVLHESADSLPGEASHATGAVQGVATPDGRVHLVARNLTADTARGALMHEVFHAGAEALIGAPAMRGILREVGAQAARAKLRIEAGKPSRADGFWLMAIRRAEEAGTPDAHMAEEIAAYAVERAERAPEGLRALADRVVGALKGWLLRRFGKQLGDVTPEQLRALAVSALRSWRDAPLTTNVARVRYSLAASTATAAQKSPDAPRSLFHRAREEASTALTALMVGTKGSAETVGKYSLLSLTPTRALFNELAKPMPSARAYLQTKEAMDAQRNKLTDSASAILDGWEKFARKKENREANKALMDIMHRSTLEQVDPSKGFEAFWTSDDQAALDSTKRGADQWDALAARKAEDAERRKAWEAMQAEFKALPPRAQTLYGDVRDAYKEMADAGEAQVVKNIQKALDHLVTKAERQHADEMQRIRDEGLTGDERDAAEKAADDKLAKVKARTVRNRAARVKNMRAEFESNRIKGPYFPLSRFGNYFVTVRDADGKVVSFSRFESARQQRRFVKDVAGKGMNIEVGVLSAKSALERNLDPKFVAEVESILDGADAPDSVRDAIWQKYLETLPDFSARKSRLHRKGRAGFAADAMRAFAHNMFHGSHQLARLTHGQDLQSLIDEIRREARDAPDPVRAGAVANEIVMVHDFAMNPKASPWALRASSFAFLWTMGANLSSAIVNLDQAWTKGIPNLAYDEDTKAGVRAAARETAKATRDFIVGRGSAENASTLTADERAAMHAGYETGLIDKTQAHDVAGIAEAGLDYNPLRHKAMKIASAPMHQTERLNREVTFLASYRIARNAGLSHEVAVRKAADLTWMTHFDNQSSSKPRFMRGDAGRTMFALKAFQANILFRLFRDMHQSMHGASPDARRMAFGRLTSTMALTAAAAGVRGAYFYGVLMVLAGAFMGMLGDDDDPEEKLRKIVLDAAGDSMIGQAVGGMLLDGIPGYITGTALSERLGMGDLWLRTPQRDMKPEQAFSYIVDQLGGAPLSLAHNVFLGAAEVGKGNMARGVEKAAPAVLRNVMKAARYAREGVKDKSGDDVVEDVPLRDVLKQAIGFTPAEIADRYARNTFQQNTQDRINAERRSALQAAARAERAGDDEALDRAMARVDEFNDRHPDREITPRDIRQSRKGMERTTDSKEFGVRLHRGLEDFIKERTAPSIYSR